MMGDIPRLYVEQDLGPRDRALRDWLYDGFLGRFYQHVMPFLALPIRPAYWQGWLAYLLVLAALVALIGFVADPWCCPPGWRAPSPAGVVALLSSLGVGIFLLRHPYLFHLLVLAVPVKLSVALTRFAPAETFAAVHERHISELLKRRERLDVLDVSTGTCNSLYRHGWMKLNASYTGLDLSETMLAQGADFMARRKVPVDLVIADAARLPFAEETFDVVLNYGALNGYTDPRDALNEMARVARKGALVLFFDEQLHASASFVERMYFARVLSSHNTIHRCPVEWIPAALRDVEVHQVYRFYYLCTGYKK